MLELKGCTTTAWQFRFSFCLYKSCVYSFQVLYTFPWPLPEVSRMTASMPRRTSLLLGSSFFTESFLASYSLYNNTSLIKVITCSRCSAGISSSAPPLSLQTSASESPPSGGSSPKAEDHAYRVFKSPPPRPAAGFLSCFLSLKITAELLCWINLVFLIWLDLTYCVSGESHSQGSKYL